MFSNLCTNYEKPLTGDALHWYELVNDSRYQIGKYAMYVEDVLCTIVVQKNRYIVLEGVLSTIKKGTLIDTNF